MGLNIYLNIVQCIHAAPGSECQAKIHRQLRFQLMLNLTSMKIHSQNSEDCGSESSPDEGVSHAHDTPDQLVMNKEELLASCYKHCKMPNT